MKISKFLLSFILVNLLSTLAFGAFNAGVVVDTASNFLVQWEIFNNDTIVFGISASMKTWVGIGWHCQGCQSDKFMANSDYVIAVFNDTTGQLSVGDYVSTPGPRGIPPIPDTSLNGTNDIISFGGYQTPDSTFVYFTRKLVTGDKIGDRDLVIGEIDFIWAHGAAGSNSFGYHGQGNAGRLNLNLDIESSSTDNTPTQGPDYVDWHASLMCISFGFLMPFGMFAARYLKNYTWWFPLHYIVQGTAFACALVGFIMAIVMMGGLDFSTTHSIFGIITLSLVLASVGLGVISHLLWKPTRTKTPIFPDIIHWVGGRLVFALSIAAIITGMKLHQVPTPLIICFAGLIGFYGIIVIWLEVYNRVYPQDTYASHETKSLINN
ncbi:hypothetical protein CYY_003108 [Polysphondylium violaceum]|uniref:Cytochrome b561 / ferric reductase transmembrane domain-containing protein n=1 Tax=Polysphondylium violaceum TaxID=133409 RepID=A0A8J4PVA8_9MYCE|nr:hypothetical protein CYY_003108 [Polysphondylium violaceum]